MIILSTVMKACSMISCCEVLKDLLYVTRCFASSIDVWAGNTPASVRTEVYNAIEMDVKSLFMIYMFIINSQQNIKNLGKFLQGILTEILIM
ncbi:MAG: hypothetical protein IJR20_06945 [Muribaculaceae bacterium]|nr:hypothetical protein [Muribaculaceae bacterium]